MRRYQLHTSAPWRAALERLRAVSTVLAGLDTPDPSTRAGRRQLRERARLLAALAWSVAPDRVRELGLAPETGDLDGWLRAGIVDAIASRPPGRLDDAPEAHAYRQGHAAALLALCTDTPLWAASPTEERPMTPTQTQESPDQPSDVESESTDIRTSKTIGRIALALAKAQGDFETVIKAGTAKIKSDKGDYAYRYADLASVIAATRQALAAHDLAVVCAPVTVERGVEVSTRLIHASGEWIEAPRLWMACDARPQNVGSAITYARRYQLLALLGLAPEDDDAAAAQESADASARPPQRRPVKSKPQQRRADPLARERAELQARVADLAKRDSADVSSVWRWATRTVGLDGLELASLDEESLAEVSRIVRGRLEQPHGKRAPARAPASAEEAAALREGRPADGRAGMVERGRPSSPDHAGAVAKVQRLADELARVRDWDIEQVLADELHAGVRLDTMSTAELNALADRLASLVDEEGGAS